MLADTPTKLDGLDLPACSMVMERQDGNMSSGTGAACLGNPLNAVAWLSKALGKNNVSLQAGDVIMTGALGPIAAVSSGDVVEVRISGLGSVRAVFGIG